jgi:recombinational DNA repair protein RecT
LPDGREAAIVPFNSRYKDELGWHTARLAQYMPMVWGLRKKILQSGEVQDIFAAVVYKQEIEAGRFIYEEGSNRQLRHQPIIDPDFDPGDEDIALAYSVATYANGTKSFEILKRWEIDDIREASQTGAAFDKHGNPREAKGPWVDWFGEMAKKSVIRRHSKSLPMSGDILPDVEAEDMAHAARSAVALLDSRTPDKPEPLIEDGDGGFDPATGEIIEPEPTPEPDPEPDPEPAPKPRRGRPPKATQLPAEQPTPAQPEPEPEPEPTPEPTPEPEPEPDPQPEPPTDSYGITVDPHQAVAEQFIADSKRCVLMMDLRRLETEADLALTDAPDEIMDFVNAAFAAARQRLQPQPTSA